MKHLAKKLRKNMTDAERLLWQHLRNRRLGGYKFRRQRPIGPYIVDFICLEKEIVIEVDGGQLESDSKRSAYLKEKGYKVLRFWNNEVLQETESVLSVVLSSLDGNVTPSPRPSPRGERENEYGGGENIKVKSITLKTRIPISGGYDARKDSPLYQG